MMLTLHGLPNKTKFQNVKDLVRQKCNISDFIMDNLVDDGFNTKKVRIGLTDENDGYRLMKCLDGFRMSGNVLKVVPVGKPSQAPPQNFDTRSNYPNHRNDYPNQPQPDYPSHDYNRQSSNPPDHTPHSQNLGPPHGPHEPRGFVDARQSLSQAMADPRHQDRYQNQPQLEIGQGDREFRNATRGHPIIRPASMDTRAFDRPGPGIHDTGSAGMRSQDNYRPMDPRPVNPEPVGNQQWNAPGNDWAPPNAMPNPTTGYNYQQPQTGYGQQPNMPLQGGYPQNRAPQTQNYQQPIAAQPPARAHVLRSVQLVDELIIPRVSPAFPPAQKPITIMKDNFQGPTQYNMTGQLESQGLHTYQEPGQTTLPWQQDQTKQLPYEKSFFDCSLANKRADKDYNQRRYSPTRNTTVRMDSPGRSPSRKIPVNTVGSSQNYPERRVSPPRPFPERRDEPPRHVTTTTDLISIRRVSPSNIPKDRRISPTRKLSPRRGSPTRRVSLGRRVSPIRHISPFRKVTPSRRVSPLRKPSPIRRRVSPAKRITPGRRGSSAERSFSPFRKVSLSRHVSPERRVSPRNVSPGKRVSPGRRHESRRMSPNEKRMGGHPSPRRYSPKRSPLRSSGRYSPSERNYDDGDMTSSKDVKPIRPAYEPSQAQKYTGAGFSANETQYAAPARNEPKIPIWQNEKITYPVKKDDREPSRRTDPDKKPSPRSRSHSPVKDRFRRHSPSPGSPRRSWALEKRRSPDVMREPPPPPLWPGQEVDDKTKPVRDVSDSDEERFDKRRNIGKYSPRFSPRREDRQYRDDKFERDYEDRPYYRRDSPKKLFNEADKDFKDVYQRAVDFRRKTKELRKSNDRRNQSYDDEDEDEKFREAQVRIEREKPKSVWIPIKLQTKDVEINKCRLKPAIKEKRDKAVEEIVSRILEPHNFTGEQRHRVVDELKLSIYNIMMEMFKDKDASYIELVIKFRARYDAKDEEKMLLDVLSSMPSHYRNLMKRKVEGTTAVPLKVARRSPAYGREVTSRPKLADSVIPDWNTSIPRPKVLGASMDSSVTTTPVIVQPPVYMSPYQVPQMYQPSFSNIQTLQASQMQTNLQAKQMQLNLQATQMQTNLQATQMQTNLQATHMQTNLQEQLRSNLLNQFRSHMQLIQSNIQSMSQSNQPNIQPKVQDVGCYDLYLCQDDFEPFSGNQAEKLKQFLVSQMFKASETGDGWAPVFTLKGLNSMYRYELSTEDEASKNWIVNLDFSEFELFNVLVYSKEQLWYERAAIWLPGHSRYRNLEPLEKLRLQNKFAEGINIGKWKFVKKVVTIKGTRLYVDMPPSAARALERQKMMLSYELGKVNVYLKAIAVDKEVFDAGLKEHSIIDPSQIATVMMGNVMPTLPSTQLGIVKVSLKGAKSITIQQAGKIKEMIVYNLFKYHQQEGRSKTDFVKYGFCPPNCIGIEPENSESRRWLVGRNFGKLNRQSIVVLDGEDTNTKYFRMRGTVPKLNYPFALQNTQVTMERLKNSNQGIKGLNFSFWKPLSLSQERSRGEFEVDVDLESAETLMKIHFKLDYCDERGTKTVVLKSDYSLAKLEEKIRKYKAEQVDSYDVANMELDSDSE